MPLPLGFIIAQLGLRAIPVLLRSGQMAMRYIVTTPGAKGKTMQELGKKVLGKNAIVDDVAKLTSKKADNVVSKIIDPKNLSASERTTLMNTTYRDSSKLLQSQKSYPTNAKLADDIQKGFGQSFSKESSGRLFIAGDRTTVAAKEVLKKTADAPKALPKPTAAQIKAAEVSKVTPLEVAKSGVGTAQTTPGLTALQRGAFRTIKRAEKGKKTIPLRVKDQKGKVTLTQAKEIVKKQQGIEKEIIGGKEVIAEGLKGVGSAPKPAWWQAMIPNVLRVGGQPYRGAYPAGISGPRVGATTGGLLFAGATIPPLAESMTKTHLAKKDILSPEQIMAMSGDAYANAYNPDAAIDKLESGDIILPERIE